MKIAALPTLRTLLHCLDGMGGQAAGEKAAKWPSRSFPNNWPNGSISRRTAPKRSARRLTEPSATPTSKSWPWASSIPICARWNDHRISLYVAGRFYVGGIGDSPAFRLSDGKLEKVTKDHSLTQALIDAGTITPEEARTHRFKNVLWRYIGTKEGGAGTEPKEFP